MTPLSLGIDGCTRWTNLALVAGDGVLLGEVHAPAGNHATGLVPAVEALLAEARRGMGDLDAVGAVVGPGSFTGLRVALAAALGLAGSLGIPAYGLGSLEALAAFAPVDGEGLAVLDARRGRVYAARFRRQAGAPLRRLSEDRDLKPEELLTGAPPLWAVGDGIPLVAGWPAGCACLPEAPNLARPAAQRALERLLAGAPGEVLQARYVRAPDAALPAR